MDSAGKGKRVRIYLGEHDRAAGHGEPLWQTLLTLLQDEGAAGATMFRAVAGFGAHGRLHLARLADVLPDLPVVVEWVDGVDRVERLLPRVAALVTTGVVIAEDVEVVKYTHREPARLPPDRVADVMTREVVTVHPETPLGEVVRALLDRDFRALPVVDAERRLVGIVTNADLVDRGGLSARVELLAALGAGAVERELSSSGVRERTAADVMTRDVVTVRGDDTLDTAAHLLVEKRVKRLPVVDDAGRLAGIVSRVDVLRTLGEDYGSDAAVEARPAGAGRTIRDVMRTAVPAVRADATLGEVLDAVISTRLNRAVVVDDERRVLGVVSDSEVLARVDPTGRHGLLGALMGGGTKGSHPSATARELMRSPAVTVTPETKLLDAARTIVASRRKVLPVVDADGRLIGIVDRADILAQALARPGA